MDCESELIKDRAAAPVHSGGGRTGRVLIEPFTPPALVLGTLADENNPDGLLKGPDEFCEIVRWRLDNGWHLVFHNISFDMQVLCAHDPGLREPFLRAADDGRLWDSMLLDQLYGLAIGRFDKPKYNPETAEWLTEELRPRSLETLAYTYCGVRLPKDNAVRLGFGAYKGRLHELPSDFRQYALQDAVLTLRVFQELWRRVQQLNAKGVLSHAIQLRAQLVCADLDQRGLHIDRGLARHLKARFEQDVAPLRERLAEAGLGGWKPAPKTTRRASYLAGDVPIDGKWHYRDGQLWRGRLLKSGPRSESATPQFHMSDKALQAALAKVPVTESPPRTPTTGALSLDAEWWAQRLPADAGALHTWLHYEKLQKVLSSYLNVYSSADRIFPRWWVMGARSGRMSASSPAVQQIPKRKYGIRAVFVPPPGMVFTKADYAAQEMYTLAEVMLNMGIKGRLYDVLTSGEDIHRYGAGLVLGKAPADVTKAERQAQKALAFGCPGGLGPVKLANYAFSNYGVKWSVDEAKAARLRFLDAFPDVDEYLRANKRSQDALLRRLTGQGARAWAEALELDQSTWNVIRSMASHSNPEIRQIGVDAERCLTVELPTGFRRAGCTFTEGANCQFQGLAAATTKTAAWLAFRAGLQIALIVHDELVVQGQPGGPEPALLEQCMLQAFRDTCPTMGQFAKVEVEANLDRWGPATDAVGKTIDLAPAAA